MALSSAIDVTAEFNAASQYRIDSSNWDNVEVQIQTPSGNINFNATNDSNSILGSSDGNAVTAINWQAAVATNTATNTVVTSTSTNGIFRFGRVGRFIQLIGTAVTVNKLVLHYTKVS